MVSVVIFGIEEAVKEAQNGGSGVVIYFRKEGRALGEVTKVSILCNSIMIVIISFVASTNSMPSIVSATSITHTIAEPRDYSLLLSALPDSLPFFPTPWQDRISLE